jgi:hypothetical protein
MTFITSSKPRIIEMSGGGQDTIVTAADITMAADVEVLIIADGASNLSLVARSGGSLMIGNGLGHNFQGGAGDDVILAGGGNLADIMALFAPWP